MFTASEVADLTRQSEAAMLDSASVATSTRTADDGGGWTNGAPSSVTTSCRVGSVRPAELRLATGRLAASADATLVVPLSAAEIPMEATVTVTFARDGSSAAYKVVGFVPLPTHAIDRRYLVRRAVS